MKIDGTKIVVGIGRIVPLVKAPPNKLEGVRRRWATAILHLRPVADDIEYREKWLERQL